MPKRKADAAEKGTEPPAKKPRKAKAPPMDPTAHAMQKAIKKAAGKLGKGRNANKEEMSALTSRRQEIDMQLNTLAIDASTRSQIRDILGGLIAMLDTNHQRMKKHDENLEESQKTVEQLGENLKQFMANVLTDTDGAGASGQTRSTGAPVEGYLAADAGYTTTHMFERSHPQGRPEKLVANLIALEHSKMAQAEAKASAEALTRQSGKRR